MYNKVERIFSKYKNFILNKYHFWKNEKMYSSKVQYPLNKASEKFK